MGYEICHHLIQVMFSKEKHILGETTDNEVFL